MPIAMNLPPIKPFVLYAAALLSLPGLAAADDSADPSAVAFKYAWPDGLKATLTQTRLNSQSANDDSSNATLTVSTDLKLTRAGDKLRVDFGRLQLVDVPGLDQMVPDQRAMLVVTAGASLPDWLITADGRFAGTQELPAFRNALMEAGKRYANGKFDSEGLRRYIDATVVDGELPESLGHEWASMVSDWIGLSLVPGDTYTGEYQTATALAPDVPVTLQTRLKLTAIGPCTRDGVERRCAEIDSISELDSASAARLVEVLNERMAKEAAADAKPVTAVSMETKVQLRTEIDTLLPHVFILDRRLRTTLGDDSAPLSIEQRNYLGDEFRYGNASAKP